MFACDTLYVCLINGKQGRRANSGPFSLKHYRKVHLNRQLNYL